MIRLALLSALSDRAAEGKVAVVDAWSFPAPRTKDAVAALAALELAGRVLVVLGPEDGIPDRSFANLADVQTIQSPELNAYDVLRSDWVVFTDATLPGETTSVPDKPAAGAPDAAGPDPRDGRGRRRRRERRHRDHRHWDHRHWDRRDRRHRSARSTQRGGRRMKDAEQILMRPVVSEKSYALMEDGTYIFVVAPDATKVDVRYAVEQAFGVRVKSVNTLNRKGKRRRNRKSNTIGTKSNTKRAIVTLAGGDKIDLFEKS